MGAIERANFYLRTTGVQYFKLYKNKHFTYRIAVSCDIMTYNVIDGLRPFG
jgi:hypothetical protein